MIPYVGCEYARVHLDGFVDGELSVDEQVAVESHLRWCRTCALRVEDLQLIGESLRIGSAAPHAADEEAQTVSDLHERVLIRVRAEEAVSFAARFREMFADMRLLWPALGGGDHLSGRSVERSSACVARAAGVTGHDARHAR
jgi:anti-sigma factor RsiW